jgi:hypothetical protein
MLLQLVDLFVLTAAAIRQSINLLFLTVAVLLEFRDLICLTAALLLQSLDLICLTAAVPIQLLERFPFAYQRDLEPPPIALEFPKRSTTRSRKTGAQIKTSSSKSVKSQAESQCKVSASC